jgi:hypothetical protein
MGGTGGNGGTGGAGGGGGAPDAGTEAGQDASGTAGDGGGDVTSPALDAADASSDAGEVEAAGPRLITVAYTGAVATVAGTPLGFDSTVRTEPVSGSFTYDAHMLDDLPNDPKRGRWQRGGMTAFTFTVKGHTVTGSGTALLETENLDPDTFRFRDGPQGDTVPRIMKLDGVAAPALVLFLAITDTTGAMLTSDALPDPFPKLNIANKDGGFEISHTFSIQDTSSSPSSSLLMQLDTLVQQ